MLWRDRADLTSGADRAGSYNSRLDSTREIDGLVAPSLAACASLFEPAASLWGCRCHIVLKVSSGCHRRGLATVCKLPPTPLLHCCGHLRSDVALAAATQQLFGSALGHGCALGSSGDGLAYELRPLSNRSSRLVHPPCICQPSPYPSAGILDAARGVRELQTEHNRLNYLARVMPCLGSGRR